MESEKNKAIASIAAIVALIYMKYYEIALLAIAICGGQILDYLNGVYNAEPPKPAPIPHHHHKHPQPQPTFSDDHNLFIEALTSRN